jgi:ribA/ribD-fused uncharacterized protein
MEKIGFWKVSDDYGEFSNWYLCSFVYMGVRFHSSEQALMWYKARCFADIEIAEKILKTNNQAEIKKLGRQVKNYDEEIWSLIRFNVMCDILYHKFSQDLILRDKLLSTGDADIYEASPYDKIWGIGSANVNDIKGENLLGRALMKVRATLK